MGGKGEGKERFSKKAVYLEYTLQRCFDALSPRAGEVLMLFFGIERIQSHQKKFISELSFNFKVFAPPCFFFEIKFI